MNLVFPAAIISLCSLPCSFHLLNCFAIPPPWLGILWANSASRPVTFCFWTVAASAAWPVLKIAHLGPTQLVSSVLLSTSERKKIYSQYFCRWLKNFSMDEEMKKFCVNCYVRIVCRVNAGRYSITFFFFELFSRDDHQLFSFIPWRVTLVYTNSARLCQKRSTLFKLLESCCIFYVLKSLSMS